METRSLVKYSETGLFADIGNSAEFPRDEIIDLVKRRDRYVQSGRQRRSGKDASIYVALGKDRSFFRYRERLQARYQAKVAGPVRFRRSPEFARDQARNIRFVFAQFVLPPPYRQITA